MITRHYVRPVGRLTYLAGHVTSSTEGLVRIGGRDDLAFAALELIERHGDKTVDSRLLSAFQVRNEIAQGGTVAAQLTAALGAFSLPRDEIDGVALDRPRIMGIVNVTPDSFSDGGRFATGNDAIDFARRLDDAGADFLDIGGESTRPGSDVVPVDEELRRIMPVIEGLVGRVRARISVDTRKAEVMRRAALAGVHVLNDVSALTFDADSLRVAAEARLPIILMHAQGDPKTMQQSPRYDNVLLDVYDMLAGRIETCVRAGIARGRILVDPGIGFGKTLGHNLELLAGLSIFHGLGVPIVLGVSRKRMIGTLTGVAEASERVPGSIAAAMAGAMQGAAILRVHDVAETRQALTVWEAANHGRPILAGA